MKTDLITIYHCDCIEYMSQCNDKQFDLAIVDPPYFSGPNVSGYYGLGYSNLGVKRAKYYKDCKHWEIPQKNYFNELERISKNRIIWGVNHFSDIYNFQSSEYIVWDKMNCGSSFSDVEIAYSSFSGGARIIRYMWNGMHQGSFGGNTKLNEKRIHPTQKPVELYNWLLKRYAKKGDTILDTHMGSGSSVIASHNMGFEITACEIDVEYIYKTEKRIKEHMAQGRFF